MEHKLAYTEVMTRSHLMILTQYVFDVSVWLTEYSVTVGSITLRLRVGGAHIRIFRKVQLKSAKTKRMDTGD